MDFARRQLEKYGWTSGKGLGRNENGIKEAIKPHMKRSTAGMGHDASIDFTNHWWSNLYDKASGNIRVQTSDSGLNDQISTKDPDAVEITNRTWRIGKKKSKKKKKTSENTEDECENVEEKSYMDHFVKKAILTSGGAKTEKINDNFGCSEDEDGELPKGTKQITDEELFQACGGLTAHKGSRHGLRATGKLSRIQEQEAKLLQLPQYSGYYQSQKLRDAKLTENDVNTDQHDDKTISKKSKKKSKNVCQEENTDKLDKKMAKKAKKRKQKEEEIFERYNSIENVHLHDSGLEISKDAQKKGKVSKKKKKCEEAQDLGDEREDTGIHLEETLDTDTEKLIEKKAKRKKKSLKLQYEIVTHLD